MRYISVTPFVVADEKILKDKEPAPEPERVVEVVPREEQERRIREKSIFGRFQEAVAGGQQSEA
jgi:hypothetical protein